MVRVAMRVETDPPREVWIDASPELVGVSALMEYIGGRLGQQIVKEETNGEEEGRSGQA